LNQNQIHLSICIPTFNRRDCLKKTLNSICSQKIFQNTSCVEIIISDNNSSDGTQELCQEYVIKYGTKIKYFKNSKPVSPDENFIIALSKGSGSLLKLNNDTLLHRPGSLNKILTLIEDSIKSGKTLFFLNGKKYGKKISYCDGVEDLVLTCSFWTTWIGGFSVWRDQFLELDDFSRYSSLKLGHVDALLRMVSAYEAVVYNDRIFEVLTIEHQGDYSLFEVFLKNYPYILSEYVGMGMLSRNVLKIEKRKVLFQLICPWVAKSIYGNKSHFNTEDHLNHVKRYFSDKKVIFYYLFRLKLFGAAIIIIQFIRRLLK
jgi:glycosyltransferase involved in cell wall biosynthesis